GEDAAGEAEGWLAQARASGADVGLVTDVREDANDPLRVRRAAGRGPLGVIRALDAEDQLRPVDGLVPFGRRARRLVRRLPGGALHLHAVLDCGADPAAAVRDLEQRTRAHSDGA